MKQMAGVREDFNSGIGREGPRPLPRTPPCLLRESDYRAPFKPACVSQPEPQPSSIAMALRASPRRPHHVCKKHPVPFKMLPWAPGPRWLGSSLPRKDALTGQAPQSGWLPPPQSCTLVCILVFHIKGIRQRPQGHSSTELFPGKVSGRGKGQNRLSSPCHWPRRLALRSDSAGSLPLDGLPLKGLRPNIALRQGVPAGPSCFGGEDYLKIKIGLGWAKDAWLRVCSLSGLEGIFLRGSQPACNERPSCSPHSPPAQAAPAHSPHVGPGESAVNSPSYHHSE